MRRNRIDIIAELLARSELTELGKATCVWMKDWSRRERAHYRAMARYLVLNYQGAFAANRAHRDGKNVQFQPRPDVQAKRKQRILSHESERRA